MNLTWLKITTFGCFALIFTACYADLPYLAEEVQASITAPLPIRETPTEAEKDETQMPRSTPSIGMDSLIEKAKEDLAQRLSVAPTQISLVEAKAVVWPDSSLGCPQPGMVYAQVQVEGLLIRLGVGKEIYFYHSGEGEDPFLCENISPVFPKSTPKNDELIPPPGSDID